MKIIDAINKINKEEKFRFRLLCDGDIYKYIGGSLYNETVGERAEWIIDNKWLNEEIEILEEEKKIPEKFDYCEENTFMNKCKENSYLTREEIIVLDSNFKALCNKINSIIDYLKSKGE